MGEREADKTLEVVQSLSDAIDWHRRAPGAFDGDVSPTWGQGRALFGGVVAAGLVRAMGADIDTDQNLRSVSVTFAGPLEPGAFECTTTLLREGKSASFVRGAITQTGTVRATAAGVFGGQRESGLAVHGPRRPSVRAPDELTAMPYIDGLMPTFSQHLDLRWTHGSYPYAGKFEGKMGGWLRFRESSLFADASGILALLDAWPAPAMSGLTMPAPASSMNWSVDFCSTRSDARLDAWWYFDANTLFAADGYTSFEASLYAPDGEFVARSRQLVGIFG